MDIEKEYDTRLKNSLEKRLKRPATTDELVNADNDSDLVTETLWQMLCEMEKRIAALEKH